MPNLTGKVAIITGSTKGIGLAIVERMINEGASVVVSSRTGSDIESITERLGDRAVGIVCDVADPEACQRLVDETVEGAPGDWTSSSTTRGSVFSSRSPRCRLRNGGFRST
jgi:NAD(P)-dependent dehydrogenase (short-subunit alcohol dehydrogenase family)